MPGARYLVALALAVTFTGLMFWFLRVMIGAAVDIDSLTTAARIEFTRLRRDSDVATRREVKPKLELPAQSPAAPMVAVAGAGGGGPAAVAAAPLTGAPGRMFGTGGGASFGMQRLSVRGGGSDRDAIPLVRIEPEYPQSAAERGVEGWVLVRFNITAIGTVKDAVVVDAEPAKVFDVAAVKAVMRWKYNPKVEEGVAVERRGVQVVLRFNMEKKTAQ